MIVRSLSRLSLVIPLLGLFMSCGHEQDNRGNDLIDHMATGGGDAQNAVVYCDDLIMNQEQAHGLPYQYPGQVTCIPGSDGQPLVDVGSHPGQAPVYTYPGQHPSTPPGYVPPKGSQWQNPGVYPNNPNQPGSPQWQNPGVYPNQPGSPQLQNPGGGSQPPLHTPGYQGEPLPY